MTKTIETPGVGFALGGIKTEQFATFEENLVPNEKVQLSTSLSFSIDQEKRAFRSTSNFKFELAAKTIIAIQVSCFFSLSEGLWEKVQKEDSLIFPKQTVIHMAMLTISTARGVLHAMTDGTPFNKYFLPTVNVLKLIPNDVEFDKVVNKKNT